MAGLIRGSGKDVNPKELIMRLKLLLGTDNLEMCKLIVSSMLDELEELNS